MKCVCGFTDENQENKDSVFSDKFTQIIGTFLRISDLGGYREHKEEVSLYACPVCNTVQMRELW